MKRVAMFQHPALNDDRPWAPLAVMLVSNRWKRSDVERDANICCDRAGSPDVVRRRFVRDCLAAYDERYRPRGTYNVKGT